MSQTHKKVIVIYLLSAAVQLAFYLIFGWVDAGYVDTLSYLDAVKSLKSGTLNMLRTPGYPLLLLCCQSVFGDAAGLTAIVVIQNILFFLSIPCFWNLANRVLHHPSVVVLSTIFYACFPATFGWNRMIMTESLSMTLTLFFVNALIHIKEQRHFWKEVLTGCLLIGLMLLRPAAIYLLPIYLLWGVLCFMRGHRRAALVILAFTGTILIGLTTYINAFQKQYGVALISSVSTQNQYVMLRDINLIRHVDNPATPFEQKLNQVLQRPCYHQVIAWNEYNEMMQEFKLPEMQDYINRQIIGNKRDFVRRRVDYFFRTFGEVVFQLPLLGESITPSQKLVHSACLYIISWFRFNVLWLICFGGALVSGFMIRKSKSIPWEVGLLIAGVVLNFVVVFLGAPCDLARLMSPSYFVIILLFSFVLEHLQIAGRYRS